MAWTKNFTLPTNFNNNNQFDTSSVLTPDMFNVPYQNTLYLKDHLDIVEGNLSNIDDSLYNLGAYDTITANADGSYTITRQTGYYNISNDLIENGYYRTTQGGHGEYGGDTGIHNLPIVIGQKNFINNLLAVRDTGEIYSGSIGIAITSEGGCWMNLGDNYTSKEQYVEYLSQNSIYIQYKLATTYTEKVEKNHYSAYNQDFILEHNKSEAERSANLLNIDDVGSTTINGITYSIKDGVITLNGTSSSFTTINLSEPLILNGVYVLNFFNDFTTSKANIRFTSDLYWTFYPTNRIIKFSTTNTQTDIITLNIAGDVTFTNAIIKPMLVKGSTAPTTYQPYNQNKHITNNEAEFLKTEYDRSANLMPLGTWTEGKGFTSDGGDNVSTDLNRCEDYISVLGNKEYIYKQNITITNYTIVEYDVNKNFIQTQASITSSFITNANTRYIRIATYISGGSSLPTECMLNEGSIALPYQEYEGKIVHLKDLEFYGTKPAIANVQCPIDLTKWNDDTLSHSSGSSVNDLYFDYDALGYIYLLPTSSSGSMTKGIVRYTGGDTDAFTWSISAITKNYIELSCATKFFLDGPASSRGTLKTANYVLEIEDMYGHTFSLPFSVNYRK